MKSNAEAEQKQDLRFEEALEKLEQIVSEMERGDLDLDKCMARFEQGMKLAEFCSGQLAETEKKVEILLRESGGDFRWQPFGESPEDPDDASEGA